MNCKVCGSPAKTFAHGLVPETRRAAVLCPRRGTAYSLLYAEVAVRVSREIRNEHQFVQWGSSYDKEVAAQAPYWAGLQFGGQQACVFIAKTAIAVAEGLAGDCRLGLMPATVMA